MFVQKEISVQKSDLAKFNLLGELEHASMHNDLAPMFWEKADNYMIYDLHGNEWIDFTSSVAVTNSGHANKYVCKAIEEAVKGQLLTTFTFPHKYRLVLSLMLRDLLKKSTGDLYKFHFLSSGAEAVECAVDLSVSYKNRDKSIIISFFNDFHGNTLQADALSGAGLLTTTIREDKIVHYLKLPFIHRGMDEQSKCSFLLNLKESLVRFNLQIEDIVSVILEPYQGRGVYVADEKFISDISRFCKNNQIILIVDEIQSGFYRTGKRFAFEYFELKPDLICLGKGISSSLPISSVAGKKHIFDKTRQFEVLTTHSANPVSCAAAIANVRYLEMKATRLHLKKVKIVFEQEVKSMAAISQHISNVECFGMVAGFQVIEKGKPSSRLARSIVSNCFKQGLLLNAPNGPYKSYLRITPPLTIPQTAIKDGFSILKNVLEQI